jgi:hypothetical protein
VLEGHEPAGTQARSFFAAFNEPAISTAKVYLSGICRLHLSMPGQRIFLGTGRLARFFLITQYFLSLPHIKHAKERAATLTG